MMLSNSIYFHKTSFQVGLAKCVSLELKIPIVDRKCCYLSLEVTRAENQPRCTCLYCKKIHFHHKYLTREHLV